MDTILHDEPFVSPLVELWLLRALVLLGIYKKMITEKGFLNDDLARAIGMSDWVTEQNSDSFSLTDAIRTVRERHATLEAQAATLGFSPELAENLDRVSELAVLSTLERQIFGFVLTLHDERLLDDVTECAGVLNMSRVAHTISVLLNAPEKAVTTALSNLSPLVKAGLVRPDRTGRYCLRAKLDLLDGHSDAMMDKAENTLELFRWSFARAPSSELGLPDFVHVQPTLDIMLPHLIHTLLHQTPGVNVLVYGVPGTGKTQLARAIADHLTAELFEVSVEDSDGDPLMGSRRLAAYSAAQRILARRRAIVLFDETEDVFAEQDGPGRSMAVLRKAWMNRALEENPVPALWLSNNINSMDAAFIRRFDVVLELGVPPQQSRERIINQLCDGLVSTNGAKHLALAERLAPAVVARAAKVVHHQSADANEGQRFQRLHQLVDNTLVAQGHRALKPVGHPVQPPFYNPAFAHADTDLTVLGAGIQQALAKGDSGGARLCLFGPPGTGKTAYGTWLAELLGRPLHSRHVSDLVSPYIGETEQNLARAFRDAEREKAVLVLDEVDSFLQDRRGAQRTWEVTTVNEMLTQIEQFTGVLVASTNMMEGLDSASLRRFDMKIKFDYLRSEQAADLLQEYCQWLKLATVEAPVGAAEIAELTPLVSLTPGDFAAIARQARFKPLACAGDFVKALKKECELKANGVKRVIGF